MGEPFLALGGSGFCLQASRGFAAAVGCAARSGVLELTWAGAGLRGLR